MLALFTPDHFNARGEFPLLIRHPRHHNTPPNARSPPHCLHCLSYEVIWTFWLDHMVASCLNRRGNFKGTRRSVITTLANTLFVCNRTSLARPRVASMTSLFGEGTERAPTSSNWLNTIETGKFVDSAITQLSNSIQIGRRGRNFPGDVSVQCIPYV